MGISLVTYNDTTVTPQDDALIYDAALGKSGLMYGGVVTQSSANVLHITGGHGAIAGRKFTIEAADISVPLTASGTLKGRLYVHLDLSDTDVPISLLVETASTLTPPIQTPDVNISNGIYEFNIVEFNVSSSTVSDIVTVAPTFHAIQKTLAAETATITFDNLPTTGDYLIDFYTSTGISYTNLDVSVPGQATLTFEEQESEVTVFCEIKGA